jgi:hypothetical protein
MQVGEMIMTTNSRTFNGTNESPVKHTEAGEMPDASPTHRMVRRLRAVAPVISNEVSYRTVLVPLVVAALGVGAYFLFRKLKNSQDKSDVIHI